MLIELVPCVLKLQRKGLIKLTLLLAPEVPLSGSVDMARTAQHGAAGIAVAGAGKKTAW
jgi:hypothetical protein